MVNLNDKITIVTGAALGIGAASAKELAKCGASVTLMDINADAAEQVAKEIIAAGGQAHVVTADASSAKDCERTVTETVETFGGLDILFNNVGIQPTSSYANVEDTTEEMWDQILGVNLKSRFLMAKYSIPHMRERG